MNTKKIIQENLVKIKSHHYTKPLSIFIVIMLLFLNINFIQEKILSVKVGEVSPQTFLANKDILYQDEKVIEQNKKIYDKNPEIYYKKSLDGETWVKNEFNTFANIVEEINEISEDSNTENLYSSLREYAEREKYPFDLVVAINNTVMTKEQVSDIENDILLFIQENGGILENEVEGKKEALNTQLESKIEHPVVIDYLNEIINQHLVATKVIDEVKTDEAKMTKYHQIEQQSTVSFKAGQKIVGKNEIITEQHLNVIKELGLTSSEFYLEKYIKLNVIYLLLIIGLFFATKSVRDIYVNKQKMLLLGILLTIGTFLLATSFMFELFSTHMLLFLPLVLIITDLFVSKRIAVFMNIIFSITIVYMTTDIMLMLTYLLSGITITLLLHNVENRSDMIKLGVYATGITMLFMLLIDNTDSLSYYDYLLMAFNILLSFFVSTQAFSVIEKRFNILTAFSLMELQQHKILDELNEEAPGTMIHSRNVAYLAKNAALKIKADHNLVYTGALLHDIGKLHNPSMFTENHAHFQLKENPMSKLSPIDSAIIIKRHIEHGVELAQQLHLPKSIENLIRTHHGESTIKYFYTEAVKSAEMNKRKMPNEEDFKYKWGKPQTKEEGILLLCDISEAVSKSFNDGGREYIAERLPKYLKDAINDGQLDECQLTLKEIAIIQESIVDSLVSLNLKRTKYQNQKD